jgi:hypothetical protein
MSHFTRFHGHKNEIDWNYPLALTYPVVKINLHTLSLKFPIATFQCKIFTGRLLTIKLSFRLPRPVDTKRKFNTFELPTATLSFKGYVNMLRMIVNDFENFDLMH